MSKPDVNEMLAGTLTWCKERDYAGHSKHDALNSPSVTIINRAAYLLRPTLPIFLFDKHFNIFVFLYNPRYYCNYFCYH